MRGGRITPDRAAVLEVLEASQLHPTAAQVFRSVRKRMPGVTYATIYNALSWLRRHGLASELRRGDRASRYDPVLEWHDHLVCRRCGNLRNYALEIPQHLWRKAGRRKGFHVETYRVELVGLCHRCVRPSRGRGSAR